MEIYHTRTPRGGYRSRGEPDCRNARHRPGILPDLRLDRHPEAGQFGSFHAAVFGDEWVLEAFRPGHLELGLRDFLDPEVGGGRGEVQRRVKRQPPAGRVRRERQFKSVGHGRDLAGLAQAPAPGQVEHDELRRARFQHLEELASSRRCVRRSSGTGTWPRQAGGTAGNSPA